MEKFQYKITYFKNKNYRYLLNGRCAYVCVCVYVCVYVCVCANELVCVSVSVLVCG